MDILSMHPKYWRGDTRKNVTLVHYLYRKYWFHLFAGNVKQAYKYRKLATEKGYEAAFKSGRWNGKVL